MGQRHVCGVAALRNEDTANPGGVVARVKGVPTVAQINFNPCGKIHRRIGRREADVSDVTGAVARRNVQATAEGDCKMRVVAANAASFLVCLERCSGELRYVRMPLFSFVGCPMVEIIRTGSLADMDTRPTSRGAPR